MCAEPASRRSLSQRGVTLIELIIFIVIITVGIVGILSVMNITTRSSADPIVRKQAVAMAEAVLEEVLSKSYCDPDLVPPSCVVSREPARTLYDDILDYDGQTIAGDSTLGSSSIPALAGFTATITVAAEAPISAVNMRRVAVTVTGGNDSVTLFADRAAGF